MIKRTESTSSQTPCAHQCCNNSVADHNGKDKYQRHGSIFELIQRWMAIHGKLMVICATALVLSVFMIPPIKVILKQSTTLASDTQQQQQKVVSKTKQQTLQIPPCPTSPWKENETLQGKCPGDLKPYPNANSISTCASSCCSNKECISWQFRADVGCLQGKDVRLGQEKDGVSAWCSDHPPQRWSGQYLKPHGDKKRQTREEGCDTKTWNPNEEIGQCFGLGDVKKDASGSMEDCMRACCKSDKCGAWQWNKEVRSIESYYCCTVFDFRPNTFFNLA